MYMYVPEAERQKSILERIHVQSVIKLSKSEHFAKMFTLFKLQLQNHLFVMTISTISIQFAYIRIDNIFNAPICLQGTGVLNNWADAGG